MGASIIATILAIFKAVPIFDSWFQAIAAAYLQKAITDHDQAFVTGMQMLLQNKDQSGLETAIGDPTAGAPSTRREGVQERSSSGE